MLTNFQQQWFNLKLALVFLTRLPVKIKQQVADEQLNLATGYFGLVGFVVAIIVASVLVFSAQVLPLEIAVILSLIASVLVTGAFHEDGLADTADGLGGGWTQQQKLCIMKDSRLGTYGASALLLAFLLKYQSLVILSQLSLSIVVISLLAAHSLSRVFAVSLIPALDYVQLDDESKTKPVAQYLDERAQTPLIITTVISLLLIYTCLPIGMRQLVCIVIVLLILRAIFKWVLLKQLDGYTGDSLGAAQQLAELALYLCFIGILGS